MLISSSKTFEYKTFQNRFIDEVSLTHGNHRKTQLPKIIEHVTYKNGLFVLKNYLFVKIVLDSF